MGIRKKVTSEEKLRQKEIRKLEKEVAAEEKYVLGYQQRIRELKDRNRRITEEDPVTGEEAILKHQMISGNKFLPTLGPVNRGNLEETLFKAHAKQQEAATKLKEKNITPRDKEMWQEAETKATLAIPLLEEFNENYKAIDELTKEVREMKDKKNRLAELKGSPVKPEVALSDKNLQVKTPAPITAHQNSMMLLKKKKAKQKHHQ